MSSGETEPNIVQALGLGFWLRDSGLGFRRLGLGVYEVGVVSHDILFKGNLHSFTTPPKSPESLLNSFWPLYTLCVEESRFLSC